MQNQKMRRKPEKRLYKLMYSSSLKVTCSFLVHLPNSCVFAVNTVLKFPKFLHLWKVVGADKGAKKISGGPWPPVEPPLLVAF